MTPVNTIKYSAIVTILRIPFIVLIALLPGLIASGQVKFTTIASSKEISRGEYLQVEFVVENAKEIEQLNPPDFPGFQVAQGPIQSSGISIINGNTSQYKAVSFVLQPTKTGKFTIQGASAVVDGKKMNSNAVTVTVNNSGTPGSANNNNNNNSPFPQSPFSDPFAGRSADIEREYVLRPGENVNDKIHKNLFVKVQVDKTNCYVGEPIVATYKLYTRLNSESRVTKHPSLNGFSVYDMVDPGSDVSSIEKLNGKPFTVHIIRKTQLIPLQAGSIDLDPVEVQNVVHFVKGGSRQQAGRSSGNTLRDLFDQMTDDNMMGPEIEENVTLDTRPVTITVKPLPEENKPAGFNGAVGNFSLQAELTNRSIAARDEATLHLIVKGKGNLPVINAPSVQWPASIEAFDPTTKEDIDKTTVPMSGSKNFDYVFTPRTPGHYTIPAIAFSYFDPSSGTYKKTETAPLDFQVTTATKGPEGNAASAGPASSHTTGSVSFKKFIEQHLEWIFAVLILSGLAFFLGRQNIRLKKSEKTLADTGNPNDAAATKGVKGKGELTERKNANQLNEANLLKGTTPQTTASQITVSETDSDRQSELERYMPSEYQKEAEKKDNTDPNAGKHSRQAPSFAAWPSSFGIQTDPLQEAKKLYGAEDYKGFYREVNRALWKAISNKIELRASELNKQEISRQLESRGWDTGSIISLERILNECEMNLYTPAYDAFNMQQLLREAESLLAKLA
jgi:oxygen tolerance protein BatD